MHFHYVRNREKKLALLMRLSKFKIQANHYGNIY